ncbi:NACHT C-terminal alpha/beta 1 domain-containing protein [Microcoleus sp. N3A4]|uniref:NACHT C-terminal alpha/beta 1 domain-containing protein n=1 Tax=Microcoleus sp. N3A4 TaxID=3055379 RepID=UPI00403FBDCA
MSYYLISKPSTSPNSCKPNSPKPTSTPSLQLLCIDSSKFDNPDRPAADIYLQLVKKHHCPKSTEGIAPHPHGTQNLGNPRLGKIPHPHFLRRRDRPYPRF